MSETDLNKAKDCIIKKYGKGSIMNLNDKPLVLERLTTGIKELDEIIGGGIPYGRFVEIFGNEGGGKSTVAMIIAASCQKNYKKDIAYIDAEHNTNPEYMKNRGINFDNMIFSQPDYGEQALEITENLVRSGEVGVIVVDSVAALTPKAEIEGEMEDQQMGLQARMMGKAMRKLKALCGKTGTIIIFINQIREKCGLMFGNPETTPGGRALKFYASIRIKVTPIGRKSHQEDGVISVDGQKVLMETKKNTTYPPFKKTELFLRFEKGFEPLVEKKIKDAVPVVGIKELKAEQKEKTKKRGRPPKVK